jgi:hypothetical protein
MMRFPEGSGRALEAVENRFVQDLVIGIELEDGAAGVGVDSAGGRGPVEVAIRFQEGGAWDST